MHVHIQIHGHDILNQRNNYSPTVTLETRSRLRSHPTSQTHTSATTGCSVRGDASVRP